MDIKIEKKKGLKKRDLFIILGALLLVADCAVGALGPHEIATYRKRKNNGK